MCGGGGGGALEEESIKTEQKRRGEMNRKNRESCYFNESLLVTLGRSRKLVSLLQVGSWGLTEPPLDFFVLQYFENTFISV